MCSVTFDCLVDTINSCLFLFIVTAAAAEWDIGRQLGGDGRGRYDTLRRSVPAGCDGFPGERGTCGYGLCPRGLGEKDRRPPVSEDADDRL